MNIREGSLRVVYKDKDMSTKYFYWSIQGTEIIDAQIVGSEEFLIKYSFANNKSLVYSQRGVVSGHEISFKQAGE